MINKKTITVNGQSIEINSVPSQRQWILVYSDNKAQVCQQLTATGVMETRNNVFEGQTFDDCQTEANRLGLLNAAELKKLADSFNPKSRP